MAAAGNTANHWLWANPPHLAILLHRVSTVKVQRSAVAHVAQEDQCIVSTRAVSEQETPYPVLTYTVGGIKRRFYAHHVVAMHKMQAAGLAAMWDTSRFHVSHDCHNNKCVHPRHLSVIPKEQNQAKNKHCVGSVHCLVCEVSFQLCECVQPCVTQVFRMCSDCRSAAESQ